MTEPASQQRVLLTGAFGGVGEWLLQELLAHGFAVTCLDLATAATRKKAARLARRHRFETQWGNLTDETDVQRIVAAVRPDRVVHAAAVIPPASIKNPGLAEAVNVGGTRALLRAAEAIGTVRRFVLVSSYSVCGPNNPARNAPRWSGTTPVAPQDDYGRQKVAAEALIRAGTLGWSIVRLCAVFPLAETQPDPDTLRFSFCLPYDRREHAIDVRDAARAIARAAFLDDADGRLFMVGGGEGWHGLGGDLTGALVAASGLKPFPREVYRIADPDVDASWFYENWVDTTESQAVLDYQRHSFDDYLRERRRRMGIARFILPLFAGVISRALVRKSPFYGKPAAPDRRPFAQAAREALGLTGEVRADADVR